MIETYTFQEVSEYDEFGNKVYRKYIERTEIKSPDESVLCDIEEKFFVNEYELDENGKPKSCFQHCFTKKNEE